MRCAVPPHILHLFFGQGSQDGFAHPGTVQRAAQPHPAGHPHGAAFRFIYVHDILCIADDQVHRFAGALGQAFQVYLGNAHHIHAVDDAGRNFKHL